MVLICFFFNPNRDVFVCVESYKTEMVKAHFQYIHFVGALRIKDEHAIESQNLFEWGDGVLNFLENRNPRGCKTLEDKKHHLVCYQFESTLQLCLNTYENTLRNPGCETFCCLWDATTNNN